MTVKQKQLILCCFDLLSPEDVDGIWGRQSEAAARTLQRRLGLTEDGVFGDGTMNAAFAQLASGEPLPEEEEEAIEIPAAGTFWPRVRYFTRDEFRCPCGACGGFPVEPQEKLVLAMDDMRDALGVPVIVVPPDGHSGGSGVRCQAYNDSLSGSVPNSRHVLGEAADFSAPGASASTIEAYLTKIQNAGIIRYWYEITPGAYHMDIE